MLHEILINKRSELAEVRSRIAPGAAERQVRDLPPVRSLRRALTASSSVAIIAEIKRKSPSKGILARAVDPAALAAQYEAGGASAISVLTDGRYFGGSIKDLTLARSQMSLPVLRKDFIVEELQIHESRVAGADAVLLIVAALGARDLVHLHESALKVGLEALVEVHNEQEIEVAIRVGARIIGINNRNLKTFEVNPSTTERLRSLIPSDVVCVSESGVTSREDIERLKKIGVDAALVGERLMTSLDPEAALRELIGGGND